jgi:hypothetical protein
MYNLKQGKSSFEPIPDGRYLLKVDGVSVSPHTKDNKDGHRFEVTFTVIDGEFKGRKVWDNIYLPWVTWKMYTLLEAGESPEASDENATPESIAAALTGLEVSAYLTTVMGTNDKPRTNVSEYKNKNVAAELASDGDGMNFDRLK